MTKLESNIEKLVIKIKTELDKAAKEKIQFPVILSKEQRRVGVTLKRGDKFYQFGISFDAITDDDYELSALTEKLVWRMRSKAKVLLDYITVYADTEEEKKRYEDMFVRIIEESTND